jgi:predicted aminopeptidase
MRSLRFFFFFSFLLLLTGCSHLLYLSKMGWRQSYIMSHSVPVEEILNDENTSAQWKEKIHFIQEVKDYGEKKLGLKKTKNYSKYFEVQGSILYVITACEKDRFQLYSWEFPITGRVTYKSFFNKEGVLKEKQFLERKGLDTYVQQAAAYSTLGWLKDPIFSSMMKWNEVTLANLILHEMAHATFYFKNETDFNEQLATFVGNRGGIDFLIEKFGMESEEVAEANAIQEDDLLFSQWIDQVCQRLSAYYAKEITRDEKLKGRQEIFRSIREGFGEIKVRLKTDCYQNFGKLDLNNAVLLAHRRYIHRLERLKDLYESQGKDLMKVVELFKKIQASGDKSVIASFLK